MQPNIFSTAHNSTAHGFVNSDNDCFIISALELFLRSGLMRTLKERKWDIESSKPPNPIVTELRNIRSIYEKAILNQEIPLKLILLRNILSDKSNKKYQSGKWGDAYDIIDFVFNVICQYFDNGQVGPCCPVHEIFGKEGKEVALCSDNCDLVLNGQRIDDIHKRAYIFKHTVQALQQENWLPTLDTIDGSESEYIIIEKASKNRPLFCSICRNWKYKKVYFFRVAPRYLLINITFNNSINDLPSIVFSNFEKLQSMQCGEFWYNAVGFILYVNKIHYTTMIYSRKQRVWHVVDNDKKVLLENYNDIKLSEPYIGLYRRCNTKSNYSFPILIQPPNLPIEPNLIAPQNIVNFEQKSRYIPSKRFADFKTCPHCNMPNPIYNFACISCRMQFNNQ